MSQLLSLRDRKRTETWAALHNAAARLTLENGPDRVTTEAIAAQANVSARTFFNYFSTKEDAILGLQDPSIDDTWLEAFDVDANLLDQVSRLLVNVVHSTEGGADGDSLRMEVVQRFPQLRQRRFGYFLKVEQLVRDVVTEGITASAKWADVAQHHRAEDISRMIVLIAGAPMRYAMQESAHAPTLDNQFAALSTANALLREVLPEIQ
ncbi:MULTISPECIES: TetR/AcrR family transcriptional regulator [unclassified Arthrobacter]|uniref:TetR/AcrR family transcriptional regulator n=1 Tax=unclassified Arthrobacter TaxID=235627 RepID=UPI00149131E1|nr:TetR/AcrR family transcriptional regulator [Arthrobacter sp. AET 35A]MBE0010762.1 TetR family transcriptional regulator [Arthrobacter sp. AET 35A]NOJ64556.1 TetR family transcriptional regulator [Arthrobacter sp. 147(2020)]